MMTIVVILRRKRLCSGCLFAKDKVPVSHCCVPLLACMCAPVNVSFGAEDSVWVSVFIWACVITCVCLCVFFSGFRIFL